MMFLIVLIFLGLIVASMASFVAWIMHILETPFEKMHGKAGYFKFAKQIKKYDWKYVNYKGLMDKNESIGYYESPKTQVKMAEEIKFGGIYMFIHNPISYTFVLLRIMKEKRKFRKKTVVHKW